MTFGAGCSAITLASMNTYDLRDDSVYVEAIPADGAEATLAIAAGTTTLAIAHAGATLALGDTTIPYDALDHRYWRIRDRDGAVSWETSPDAAAWTVQARASDAALALDAVTVQLSAHSAQATSVSFADLNGGTPRGAWCPARTFRDDFSAANNRWARQFGAGSCTTRRAADQLEMSIANGNGLCQTYFLTGALFDLTAGSIAAQLVQPPAMAGLGAGIGFTDNRVHAEIGMRVQDGKIFAFRDTETIFVEHLHEEAFAPDKHRWMEIREVGGSIEWRTSRDGTSWDAFHRATVSDATDRDAWSIVGAGVLLEGFSAVDPVSPGTVIFDNYNTSSE
jgi:hypothetical protein